MKLIPSIFSLFIALNHINGEMPGMNMFYNMSTTDDMATTDDMVTTDDDMGTTDDNPTTTMYTTDILVTEPDLIPDSDPFDETCLFGLSSSIILSHGEDASLDLCGMTMNERVLVNIEVTIPADKWTAVGFQPRVNTLPSGESYMKGYAVVIPIYSRDLIEIWMDGPVSSGTKPGEVLESTITVISDVIEGNLRTITFQRYATIKIDDIGQSADNLLAVNDYYYNFADLEVCGAEATVIYAFGPADGVRYRSYTYHGRYNRGHRNLTINAEEGEMCDESDGDTADSANHYMILATFIISSIIAMLL